MAEIQLKSDFPVEVIQQCGDDLMVAKAAWVSTGNDPKAVLEQFDPKVEGVLKFLIKNRHGTPFEHGFLTIRVECPIFIWREWHRHRIGFSYNEESGRYMKLRPVFYVPSDSRLMNCLKPEGFKPSKPGFRGMLSQVKNDRVEDEGKLVHLYQQAYDLYEKRLERGYDNGLARIDLPVGIYSACYVSCNPRSLMSFLELRTDEEGAMRRSHPLWEMHQVAKTVENVFSTYWPLTHRLWNENGRVAP